MVITTLNDLINECEGLTESDTEEIQLQAKKNLTKITKNLNK
jgi:hypothetical protein